MAGMGKARRAGRKGQERVALDADGGGGDAGRPARSGARGNLAEVPAQDGRARALWGSRSAVIAAVVLLGVGVALVIDAHAALFFAGWTDENVHAYVARRISEGAVLYRDVESARPPLVILPLALFIRLGLSPLLAARGLVVLATLATAAVLLLGGRRLFSLRAGVLAATFLLMSPEVVARLQYTGMHLVELGTTTCLVLALLGRPLPAGAAFGLALGAGQHSLIMGTLAGLWLAYRQRGRALWFVAGFAGALIAVFGLARLMGGQHLWENLIARHLYHLGGSVGDEKSDLGPLLLPWIADNLLIFALALVAIVRPPSDRRGPGEPGIAQLSASTVRSSVRALGAAAAIHLGAVLVMSGGLFLYVVPIFPLVCLLAGEGADRVLTWVVAPLAKAARRPRIAAAVGGAMLVALAGWKVAQDQQQMPQLPVLPFFPHPRIGELVHVQNLHVVDVIAHDLDRKMAPGETLFGHGPIVAQAAIAAKRRVAGELADLAPRWIEQGMVSQRSVITKIENDGVGAMITPQWLLVRDPQFHSYLEACYQRPQRYPRARAGDGRGLPDIYVYLRKQVARPCLPADLPADKPPPAGG
jgi:hypothetical protein